MNEKEVKFTKKKRTMTPTMRGQGYFTCAVTQLLAEWLWLELLLHKRKQTITEIRIVKKSDGENQRTFSVAIADRVVCLRCFEVFAEKNSREKNIFFYLYASSYF